MLTPVPLKLEIPAPVNNSVAWLVRFTEMLQKSWRQMANLVSNSTPTLRSAVGTTSGDYTTVSVFGVGGFVDVDGTNLVFTTIVPKGFRLFCWANGTCDNDTAGNQIFIQIFDTQGSISLDRVAFLDTVGGTNIPFSLSGDVVGDDLQHTVKLQFCVGGAGTARIRNNNSGFFPKMRFLLLPSL
jgi:hypothetical protein